MTKPLSGSSLLVTLCVLAVAVAACGSEESPTTPTPPTNPPPSRVVKANPSFANDVQEIFNRRGCNTGNCHGAAESAGLSLTDAARSFAELVNVRSQNEADFLRVLPNNADSSYLVIKLEGRQQVGVQMPRGGTPLDTIDLGNIRNWINTGAANNE